MATGGPTRAWLLMAAGDDRGHGGNAGYDDQIDAYYTWDSAVPNHKNPRVGDRVAIWDKKRLLGLSVIEQIETAPGSKTQFCCPHCGKTRLAPRKTALPRFRCSKCGAEFDSPIPRVVDVTQYRARYDAAWTALDDDIMAGREIRALGRNVREFNSIRALDWPALHGALLAKGVDRAIRRVESRADLAWPAAAGARVEFAQGFGHALVRIRRGQQQFREQILAAQGSVCAFTGDAPARVLEAGHLYSYARLGTHVDHGGLMLRRDVHRLFDDGLLAVEPTSLRVDVAPSLAAFPQYARLDGESITLRLRDQQVEWLAKHWDEHRVAS